LLVRIYARAKIREIPRLLEPSEQGVPVRMTGPSELELNLPAYSGRSRMLLGRAVSAARAEFRVEEEQ